MEGPTTTRAVPHRRISDQCAGQVDSVTPLVTVLYRRSSSVPLRRTEMKRKTFLVALIAGVAVLVTAVVILVGASAAPASARGATGSGSRPIRTFLTP
jgi:hypothetical protein